MKKNFLTLLLLSTYVLCNAQIALEHSYSISTTSYNVSLINVGNAGYKYCAQDANKVIKLYNLDHSLFKSFTYPGTTVYPSYVMWITDNVFNSDNKIEYLLLNNTDSTMKIYNEDQNLLFTVNHVYLYTNPIFHTGTNYKIICTTRRSTAPYYNTEIYSLPGAYSAAINTDNLNNNSVEFNLYPNPSNSFIKIDYEIPDNKNSGELIIFDSVGREVKRYLIDKAFNNLVLSNEDLKSGTYFYQIRVDNSVGIKKVLVVK